MRPESSAPSPIRCRTRACFINPFQAGRRGPQGLKPAFFFALNGTAEAVPYPRPIYETRSNKKTMIRQVLLLLLLGAPLACASDYFVDCNYGSNGNPGSSPQQAWRSLLQVGISSFQPGDTINLKRDCTWNETLTPPSSGNSGSLIKIDSYGNG